MLQRARMPAVKLLQMNLHVNAPILQTLVQSASLRLKQTFSHRMVRESDGSSKDSEVETSRAVMSVVQDGAAGVKVRDADSF